MWKWCSCALGLLITLVFLFAMRFQRGEQIVISSQAATLPTDQIGHHQLVPEAQQQVQTSLEHLRQAYRNRDLIEAQRQFNLISQRAAGHALSRSLFRELSDWEQLLTLSALPSLPESLTATQPQTTAQQSEINQTSVRAALLLHEQRRLALAQAVPPVWFGAQADSAAFAQQLTALRHWQSQELSEDTCLLVYALNEPVSFVWLIDRQDIILRRLPSRTHLLALLQRAVSLLQRPVTVGLENLTDGATSTLAATAPQQPIATAKQEQPPYETLAALRQALLQPLLASLSNQTHRRLYLIMDDALRPVPFAALPLSSASQSSTNSPAFVPLLTRYEITYWTKAATPFWTRTLMTQRQPAFQQAAIIADPALVPPPANAHEHALDNLPSTPILDNLPSTPIKATTSSQSLAALPQTIRAALASPPTVKPTAVGSGETILPLRFARAEAEIIARLAPSPPLRVFGIAASPAFVRSGQLANYEVIHFATHSARQTTTTGALGLQLARNAGPSALPPTTSTNAHDAPPIDQGNPFSLRAGMSTLIANPTAETVLSAQQVQQLRLHAELVVLSACASSLPATPAPEAPTQSLADSFLDAGAQRVIGSLWPINDAATATLMTRFYRYLWQSPTLPPAAALRQAQLDLAASPHWQAPFFWGAFVLAE